MNALFEFMLRQGLQGASLEVCLSEAMRKWSFSMYQFVYDNTKGPNVSLFSIVVVNQALRGHV